MSITTLPAAGTLTLDGDRGRRRRRRSLVGDAAGDLVFTPAADANGTAYASFTFQVQRRRRHRQRRRRHRPERQHVHHQRHLGQRRARRHRRDRHRRSRTPSYTFAAADFGFTDPIDSPANAFAGVIDHHPARGRHADAQRRRGHAGPGDHAADIAAGKLTFTPAADANGDGLRQLHLPGARRRRHRQRRRRPRPERQHAHHQRHRGQRRAQLHRRAPNQTVLEDAGAQTVNPWATAISAGPANESRPDGQLRRSPTTPTPALFSPARRSPDGALTYTPAANANGTRHDHAQDHRQRRHRQRRRRHERRPDVHDHRHRGQRRAELHQGREPDGARGRRRADRQPAGPPASAPVRPTSRARPSTFCVTNDNNGLVRGQPGRRRRSGTLTYTPAANANGTATVTVTSHDNGGTANGGVDTQRHADLHDHRHRGQRRAQLHRRAPNQTVARGRRRADRHRLGHRHQRRPGQRVEPDGQLRRSPTTPTPRLFSRRPPAVSADRRR